MLRLSFTLVRSFLSHFIGKKTYMHMILYDCSWCQYKGTCKILQESPKVHFNFKLNCLYLYFKKLLIIPSFLPPPPPPSPIPPFNLTFPGLPPYHLLICWSAATSNHTYLPACCLPWMSSLALCSVALSCTDANLNINMLLLNLL